MVKAVVGANWGDEGKGKITDMLAENADIVVRFQGGSNAGHTIINDNGKFALHQLPSGIFNRNITNVIGNGAALNIEYLLNEIENVKSANGDINLLISDRAQLLLPHHILLDTYEEERLAERKFGSTKSGIAPFYSEKYLKTGVQLWEVYENPDLRAKIDMIYEKVNVIFKNLYGKPPLNAGEVYENVMDWGGRVRRYAADTSKFLRGAVKSGRAILLEGQLGALKDTDHGIYPYVTSSSPLAGFAAVGCGIPPYEIKDILCVTKAYSSAVGEGPFVTELFGDEAEELRRRGGDAGEYGATTGRPRRVGHFDAVATRYGCEIQGATEAALTCLDVLGYQDVIKICVGYEIDGRIHEDFPVTAPLYRAKPIYAELPGWKCDIRGALDYAELPANARGCVEFIEDLIGLKFKYVSTGPKSSEIIMR